MSRLSLGVIGTSAKENEHRLPLHPDHLSRLAPGVAARTTLEHGYAARFGVGEILAFQGRGPEHPYAVA